MGQVRPRRQASRPTVNRKGAGERPFQLDRSLAACAFSAVLAGDAIVRSGAERGRASDQRFCRERATRIELAFSAWEARSAVRLRTRADPKWLFSRWCHADG